MMRKFERGELPPGVIQRPYVKAPPRAVMKAVNTLGLSPKVWESAKLKAVQEVGRFLTVQMTGKIAMIKTFDCLEQVDVALEAAKRILNGEDINPVTVDQKIMACNVIAACAKAHRDLTNQAMQLAEKSADRVSTEKPKNLPPMVNLQVNVDGRETKNTALPPANSVLEEAEETPPE